jgi:hypothetical protein
MTGTNEVYEDLCVIPKGTKAYTQQKVVMYNDMILADLSKHYITGEISYRRFKKLAHKHSTESAAAWEVLREFSGADSLSYVRIHREMGKVILQVKKS